MSSPPSAADPSALVGPEWELISGTKGDEQVRISPQDPAILRFDGKGRTSGYDGCNWFGGEVTLEPGRATFGPAAGTMRACGDADTTGVPATEVMPPHGDYTFVFDDKQLVLSRDDTVLTFEVAASIWPSDRGSDRPKVLDEGEHGTGDYRLTWYENLDKKNAELDQWSLQIESRTKPGVQIGWNFWSIGHEWPASTGACGSTTIGKDAYVAGFAPKDTATATVTDKAGTTVGTLKLYHPDWNSDLVVYAGWLTAPGKGLAVHSFDADGTELPPACKGGTLP